jgi:Na+/phosphate symporter
MRNTTKGGQEDMLQKMLIERERKLAKREKQFIKAVNEFSEHVIKIKKVIIAFNKKLTEREQTFRELKQLQYIFTNLSKKKGIGKYFRHTQEYKDILSKVHTGIGFSKEHIEAMKKGMKNRSPEEIKLWQERINKTKKANRKGG